MKQRKYGYIRVSSVDQNESRQIAAMKELSIPEEHIFIDKQSGKDFDRPAYQHLIEQLREGDVPELANTLQVCFDSGAKKVLLPISAAADLATVPSELVGCFNLIFYQNAEDAVFKALGLE